MKLKSRVTGHEVRVVDETSLDDKKVTYGKNNCLIHTISLVIICLLLTVMSISCYYYYTSDWILKGNVLYFISE